MTLRSTDLSYAEQYEIDIDFSQVRQREFYKEANVTAKIEQCEYSELDSISLSEAYYFAHERMDSGDVSFGVISGKIDSSIPLHIIHGSYQSDDLDITGFEDDEWCMIQQDFSKIVIISYEEKEPTYEDAVRMLKEAKLTCSFSPEPLMRASEPEWKWGEFGPHYCIPFDLSVLEN